MPTLPTANNTMYMPEHFADSLYYSVAAQELPQQAVARGYSHYNRAALVNPTIQPNTTTLRATANNTNLSRIDKDDSGLRFTQIATPSEHYSIFGRLRTSEHPNRSDYLATHGRQAPALETPLPKRYVGKGGFASVRLAGSEQHPVCVVKKIKNAFYGELEMNAIELLERIPADKQHLFVQTFESIQARGVIGDLNTYIFQEYMNQGDLLPEKKHACPDFARNLALAKAMTAPVAALHQAELYHLDIKPENYLVGDDTIKLGDFGFLTDRKKTFGKTGTGHYLPPEVCTELQTNARADAFALGETIYELTRGVHPLEQFRHCDTQKLALCIRFQQACLRATEQNTTAPTVNSIAFQLMHPDPETRLTVPQAEQLLNSVTNTGSAIGTLTN